MVLDVGELQLKLQLGARCAELNGIPPIQAAKGCSGHANGSGVL